MEDSIKGAVNRIHFGLLPLMLALTLSPRGAAAQEVVEEPYTGPKQVLSTNPLTFGWAGLNLEYERRLSSTVTAGLTSSINRLGEGYSHYFGTNALLRYYPERKALSAFFVGGRTGVSRVSEGDGDEDVVFGLGCEVDHTWLLGVHDRFQYSLGAGFSRILARLPSGVIS